MQVQQLTIMCDIGRVMSETSPTQPQVTIQITKSNQITKKHRKSVAHCHINISTSNNDTVPVIYSSVIR